MFNDEKNCEPFDPFNVGPPNFGQRVDFKLPCYPTYPPPVLSNIPPAKKPSNSVGFQDLQPKPSGATTSSVKMARSQMGEVAISKAINEEMAATKQQAVDKRRIDAGGISQTELPHNNLNAASHASIRTLLPINRGNNNAAPSQTSVRSTISTASGKSTSEVNREKAAKQVVPSRTSMANAITPSKKSLSAAPSKKSLLNDSAVVNLSKKSIAQASEGAEPSKRNLMNESKSKTSALKESNTTSPSEASMQSQNFRLQRKQSMSEIPTQVPRHNRK
ncbi:uncharacterized protein LOC115630647 isoform X2 [Scaptodrosophila lebanonensis]|uniref:Uncharacterized protein LOC115630647 isoform X2 n=1 Tax=Drosophila lebanonensis TaxID=7225 RepID=A0A6J2U7K0_DROLE|nr:uncharacterized protein LOC115630647 isoform X2 [Scaptodrosophila lebanonensis]